MYRRTCCHKFLSTNGPGLAQRAASVDPFVPFLLTWKVKANVLKKTITPDPGEIAYLLLRVKIGEGGGKVDGEART